MTETRKAGRSKTEEKKVKKGDRKVWSMEE